MYNITLQIFTDLASVEPQWREFEKTAHCTVFQTFDWMATWYRHIGSKRDLTPIIVVGTTGDNICFLIPLAVERSGMVHRLIWFGADLADYSAPLLAHDFPRLTDDFRQVWRDVVTLIWSRVRFDLIDLDRMPAITCWTVHNPFIDLPNLWVEPYSGHIASLTDNWQQFYTSKVSSSNRQTDRRKFKNLAKMGDIQYVTVTDEADIRRTVSALIEQKRASYRRMGVEDLFDREGYPEFFHAVAGDAKLADRIHITRLDVGNQIAASGICLRHRDREYLVMASYDEEFAKHSPGRKHLHELMTDAINHDIRQYDFTIGDEPYKFDWSDIHIPLLRHVKAASARGIPVVAVMRARQRVDVWYNTPGRLPMAKRLVKQVKRAIRNVR